jgi:hypothetical protein
MLGGANRQFHVKYAIKEFACKQKSIQEIRHTVCFLKILEPCSICIMGHHGADAGLGAFVPLIFKNESRNNDTALKFLNRHRLLKQNKVQ